MDSEVDYVSYKDKSSQFLVFVDQKITCCKADGLHTFNDIGTLDTGGFAIFL